MFTWFRPWRRRPAGRRSRPTRSRPTFEPLEERCLLAQITEFSSGITPGSSPAQITLAADGNLWFTEQGNNAVARITTAGAVTEFMLPTTDNGPFGIASGPNGLLFFTEV